VLAQTLHGLSGDLDIAHEIDLANLADADLLFEGVLFPDLEDRSGLADAEALGIQVDGTKFSTGGDEAADLRAFRGRRFARQVIGGEQGELEGLGSGRLRIQGPGLFGQTDGDQRTGGALGRVFEGRGDEAGAGGGPGLTGEAEGFGEEGVVKGDADALAGSGVVDDAFGTSVAVIAQDDGLDGELDAVGGPGFELLAGVAGFAVFVVDGGDGAGGDVEEVHAGDEAVAVGGEGDRAGFELIGELGRRGEAGAFAVDPGVLGGAFEGVGAGLKESLDPLIEEEAGAVTELVEHAGGEVVGQRAAFGCGGGIGENGKSSHRIKGRYKERRGRCRVCRGR
jgi:hypothetical protein